MKASSTQSIWAIIATLILSAAAWYIKTNYRSGNNKVESDPSDTKHFDKKLSAKNNKKLPKAILSKFTKVVLKSQEFDILKNCTIDQHRNNDGDSFFVNHGSKKTEFRLYFVDAPESRLHKHNGARIKEQSEYFGLEMQVTTAVGKIAKSFVADILSKPFTVVTKWENVYTPERKYCYVIVNFNGKPTYLHELLTAKGLIRFKTRGAALPDNQTSYYEQKRKLQDLEKAAKKAKLGAWGI